MGIRQEVALSTTPSDNHAPHRSAVEKLSTEVPYRDTLMRHLQKQPTPYTLQKHPAPFRSTLKKHPKEAPIEASTPHRSTLLKLPAEAPFVLQCRRPKAFDSSSSIGYVGIIIQSFDERVLLYKKYNVYISIRIVRLSFLIKWGNLLQRMNAEV